MNATSNRNAVRENVSELARRWIIPALAVVALLILPLSAHSQGTMFAGVVVGNNCNAQVWEPDGTAWVKLNSPRGVPRPLVDGEKVKCAAPTGSLTIFVSKSYKTVSGSEIYRVQSGAVLSEVVKYSDLAATRGEQPPETIFYSPPSQGAIEPEHFVVRWNPPPGAGELTLSVAPENGGKDLCGSLSFAGSTKSVDSSELRDALAQYRDHGALDPLVMRLRDAEGQAYSVSFTVLTPPNAKKLTQDLAKWDSKDALVRHLGRGSVYSTYALYFEAAEESELALKESPKSALLLQLAANAERRTGNSARAAELERELSQVTAKAQ
jgi:hypothetical protein